MCSINCFGTQRENTFWYLNSRFHGPSTSEVQLPQQYHKICHLSSQSFNSRNFSVCSCLRQLPASYLIRIRSKKFTMNFSWISVLCMQNVYCSSLFVNYFIAVTIFVVTSRRIAFNIKVVLVVATSIAYSPVVLYLQLSRCFNFGWFMLICSLLFWKSAYISFFRKSCNEKDVCFIDTYKINITSVIKD